jgi:chitooligosaccharide deacetylase
LIAFPRLGAGVRVAALAAAAVAATACGVPGVVVPSNGLLRDVHLRGPGGAPVVALTFDDGPNGRCTEAVLDALAETRTPATFFVLGANVDARADDALLARMVGEGHEIALHGYRHGVRRLFWRDLTETDLGRASEAVGAALARAGAPPAPIRFYRPPYGFLLGPTVRAAAARDLTVVLWTLSARDWARDRRAADVAADLVATVSPGDVIVLHDGHETHRDAAGACRRRAVAAEAVRLLLPALAARGLHVAPLAQVLGLDDPVRPARTPATPARTTEAERGFAER